VEGIAKQLPTIGIFGAEPYSACVIPLLFFVAGAGAWLAPCLIMVPRVVQLADGEELISFDAGERSRSTVLEDPRRAALERRRLFEATFDARPVGGPPSSAGRAPDETTIRHPRGTAAS
jgi:hypothetical protein